MTSNSPQSINDRPPADFERVGMQVRRKSRPELGLAIPRTATRMATVVATTEAAICKRFKRLASRMKETATPIQGELVHVSALKPPLNQLAELQTEGVW